MVAIELVKPGVGDGRTPGPGPDQADPGRGARAQADRPDRRHLRERRPDHPAARHDGRRGGPGARDPRRVAGGRRRLTAEPSIEVVAATPARWADIATLFEGDSRRGCWCQYWRQSSGAYGAGGPARVSGNLRAQTDAGPPAPGVIADLEGEPRRLVAGSVRVRRWNALVRSRTIPAIDDLPVRRAGGRVPARPRDRRARAPAEPGS